jgi:hypothetical protein
MGSVWLEMLGSVRGIIAVGGLSEGDTKAGCNKLNESIRNDRVQRNTKMTKIKDE